MSASPEFHLLEWERSRPAEASSYISTSHNPRITSRMVGDPDTTSSLSVIQPGHEQFPSSTAVDFSPFFFRNAQETVADIQSRERIQPFEMATCSTSQDDLTLLAPLRLILPIRERSSSDRRKRSSRLCPLHQLSTAPTFFRVDGD
jgi:hypothetical protein